jgi:hypothetical protein
VQRRRAEFAHRGEPASSALCDDAGLDGLAGVLRSSSARSIFQYFIEFFSGYQRDNRFLLWRNCGTQIFGKRKNAEKDTKSEEQM